MTDLFGVAGTGLLDRLDAAGPVPGPGRLAAPADRRPGRRDRPVRPAGPRPAGRRPRLPGRPEASPGSARSWPRCSSPRSVTCTRFPGPAQLASWAGLTPKHHESDTHVHRGRITKQGSRLVRWAAIESVQALGPGTGVGQLRERGSGTAAAATSAWSPPPASSSSYVYYALRDDHVRALHHRPRVGGMSRPEPDCLVGAGRAGHDPRTAAWSRVLIDPAGQDRTANPIMPPPPRRRDDRAAPPACPPDRDTGPDERNAPPPDDTTGANPSPSPLPIACAERRRRQGPTAAPRSGSARALTPTPTSARPATSGESRKQISSPLTGPAPSGMTCENVGI